MPDWYTMVSIPIELTKYSCFNLLFSGRLVIDHNCRTNDPNIYAAGTLTKYSRRYYAQSRAHKFYNRMEIGHCLGLAIKQLLSPHSVSIMLYSILCPFIQELI